MKNTDHGSKIPWHPSYHLIITLVHDRRSNSQRSNSVQQLFKLTAHPLDEVSLLAFRGLFIDSDEHVQWVTAQLAMDFSLRHQCKITEKGNRDDSVDQMARKQSLAQALKRLDQAVNTPLTSVPPAWINTPGQRRYGQSEDEAGWGDADPSFNAAFAAKLFPLFPIKAWCNSSLYRPMIATTLKELVAWTAKRLMPPWLVSRHRRRSRTGNTSLIEWNRVLGDLLARAGPFFDVQLMRKEFLAPFLSDEEEGLAVLTAFADMTVTRQILDAPTIPENTFDLLDDCVNRVIRDRSFKPGDYRAGEVYGHDMPRLIEALLFIAVKKEAPGAARFANGDWSEINVIMPIITKLVTAIGWSTYVMDKFLALCEQAGDAYLLEAFADRANAVLSSLDNAKGSWAGTNLPSRTAATVQRLTDANFPLRSNQAQELLKVLDKLIDLGDRRSAALEQAEVFRGIQQL